MVGWPGLAVNSGVLRGSDVLLLQGVCVAAVLYAACVRSSWWVGWFWRCEGFRCVALTNFVWDKYFMPPVCVCHGGLAGPCYWLWRFVGL
jgi:hypothetical protein